MPGKLPSNHDAVDLVDGDGCPLCGRRALSSSATRAPRSAARARGCPRSTKYAVMPVARKVWQQVEGGSPAAAARRLIMARTTRRCNARPVSQRLAGSTLWKSAAFGPSTAAAAR